MLNDQHQFLKQIQLPATPTPTTTTTTTTMSLTALLKAVYPDINTAFTSIQAQAKEYRNAHIDTLAEAIW